MRSTFASSALTIFALIATPLAAVAEDFFCGYDPEIHGEFEYPFNRGTAPDSLRAMIVFVHSPIQQALDDFPNQFDVATHGTIVSELNQLVYSSRRADSA